MHLFVQALPYAHYVIDLPRLLGFFMIGWKTILLHRWLHAMSFYLYRFLTFMCYYHCHCLSLTILLCLSQRQSWLASSGVHFTDLWPDPSQSSSRYSWQNDLDSLDYFESIKVLLLLDLVWQLLSVAIADNQFFESVSAWVYSTYSLQTSWLRILDRHHVEL